jgi:hypothetical protein
MISSYRLGDLVLKNLNKEEINEIIIEHPNSIGKKYIYERVKNKRNSNIEIITKIVVEEIIKNKERLPKDIRESTVIHLRLGDVVAGTEWHEKEKRPLEIEYLKGLNIKTKKYVIGKCFFAKLSSRNYEECIESSKVYLESVLKELECEHYDSGDADLDLCCAVMSKVFVQGKGYYSKLIVEIRNKLNLPNITL